MGKGKALPPRQPSPSEEEEESEEAEEEGQSEQQQQESDGEGEESEDEVFQPQPGTLCSSVTYQMLAPQVSGDFRIPVPLSRDEMKQYRHTNPWTQPKHPGISDIRFWDLTQVECDRRNLTAIMGMHQHWNDEIIAQFYSTLWVESDEENQLDSKMHWTIEGNRFSITYFNFAHILGFDDSDYEKVKAIVFDPQEDSEWGLMYDARYADPKHGVEFGLYHGMKPYFWVLNNMLRVTLTPKDTAVAVREQQQALSQIQTDMRTLAATTSVELPPLAQFTPLPYIEVPRTGSHHVQQAQQLPVRGLRLRQRHDDVQELALHCRLLPPPPFVRDPSAYWHLRPAEITSYAVVDGGKHVCISVDGGGGSSSSYCLSTKNHAWTKVVGAWTMPFRGKVEYVPELGLWFGFSIHNHRQLAAADLSDMDSQPRLVRIISSNPQQLDYYYYYVPEEWEEYKDPQLVSLGSGRFCVVRFFQTTRTLSMMVSEDTGDQAFAVFTAAATCL
ncbi:hypothetical protein PR202_ga20726 [Eleusine coracana subsp. coracana]|uniref:Uncharacterized protein n=1 Tax=Eleusine coracana subsp. coracana TaxID=191504 RepID=A0AAV5CYP1_ELECO|nr:hypothetical protein PR202_ga20726 [Eleusine coracana subsp. coracana]